MKTITILRQFFLGLFLLGPLLVFSQTTYTAVASGSFTNANTWDTQVAPPNPLPAGDQVIIENQFVTLISSYENGGTITVLPGFGSLSIANGGELINNATLLVQSNPIGSALGIATGGSLENNAQITIASTINRSAPLRIQGGTFNNNPGSTLDVNRGLVVFEFDGGTLANDTGATINLTNNTQFNVFSTFSFLSNGAVVDIINDGIINIDGSTISYGTGVPNPADNLDIEFVNTGTVNAISSPLFPLRINGLTLDNTGIINSIGGVSLLNGTIDNSGGGAINQNDTDILTGYGLIVDNALINNGTLTPTVNSRDILVSYFDLTGNYAGTGSFNWLPNRNGFDEPRLEVTGTANVTGQTLNVTDSGTLSGATIGDTFEVLTAAGGVTGPFGTEVLPSIGAAREVVVVYEANRVFLRIAEVNANTAPTAVCQDFTAQLDATGNVTILASDIDNGSSDPDGDMITLSLDRDTFDCSAVGTAQMVTLTVDDGNGETATCTAMVTVEDNVLPEANCVAPFSVQLDDMGMVVISAMDIDNGSTDACGVDSISIDVTDFTCADIGENTVTLTVTDVNGNISMCTTVVTVEDNTPVTITSGPVDIFTGSGPNAGGCEATVNYGPITLDSFTIEDNCGDASNTTVVQTGGLGSGASFPVGTTVEEYTITDNNGNETVYSFEINITDTTNPVIDCPSDDVTVGSDDEGNYMIEDYSSLVSDNCSSGDDLVITQDPVAGTVVTDPSTTEVAVTATDDAGNTTTCSFNLVVDDTLGVNDVSLESGLSLYPNPTSDMITITATASFDTIKVYDVSGRVVAQQKVSATTAEVSLASFSSGIYLVQITQGSNTVTKRVIKE